MPAGEVPAALTLSGLWVAAVAVAIALAWPALREAPEARQAVGAVAASGALEAVALARGLVAEGADGAAEVTVAGCGERLESKGRPITVRRKRGRRWCSRLQPAGLNR